MLQKLTEINQSKLFTINGSSSVLNKTVRIDSVASRYFQPTDLKMVASGPRLSQFQPATNKVNMSVFGGGPMPIHKQEIAVSKFVPPLTTSKQFGAKPSSNGEGALQTRGRKLTMNLEENKQKHSFVSSTHVKKRDSSMKSVRSLKSYPVNPSVLHFHGQHKSNRVRVKNTMMNMNQTLATERAEPLTSIKQQQVESFYDIYCKDFILAPHSNKDTGKKTLVLSLDEILTFEHQDSGQYYDFANEENDSYVIKRPGLENFLREMSQRFELVVYSQGTYGASNEIFSEIDQAGYISHRLYNQNTSEFAYKLKSLGRELKDVILMVPAESADLQLYQNQALPIQSWQAQESDQVLADITPFLLKLGLVNNCSTVIKDVIINDQLDFTKVDFFLRPQNIYSFPRQWKCPKQPEHATATKQQLRLAHWNIQAQKLTNKSIYPQVQEKWLDWSHRFPLIKQHLREMDADILGLSELDTLHKELELYANANIIGRKVHIDIVQFLSSELGYDNYILEKDSGLCASAIFWKRDKYECLEKGKLNLNFRMINSQQAETIVSNEEDGDFGLAYTRLAPKVPDSNEIDLSKQFVIGETHLKAMDEGRVARTAQTRKISNFFKDKFDDVPLILAGDMNDFPWSDPVQVLRESCVDLYSLKSIQAQEQSIQDMDRQDFEFPDYTLICDIRKAKIGPTPDHRCLDYVFVRENEFFKKNQILVEKYLELPRRQYVPPAGEIATLAIPGPEQPSDHFSLVYDINIVYNDVDNQHGPTVNNSEELYHY